MLINAVDEYNDAGHLIYADNYTGAFVRGRTREEALAKFPNEIRQYLAWTGGECDADISVSVVQEKLSSLQVCDADSDVIFGSELTSLTKKEYAALKALAMKSARDFQKLYASIPDKDNTVLSPRATFYGAVPITAHEMYEHTKSVNSYYFGEIGIDAVNEPDIAACRLLAFEALEKQAGYLENHVYTGIGNEQWSLKKVCRRFVWHDRIHARAMYKMASRLCGADHICDPFRFGE